MRMLTRSIPVAALALALGAVTAAAQESGQRDFQWYIGPQAGVMLFDTPVQDRKAMPSFGGQTLIVARRTGLMISVEEGVGTDEVSAYNDLSGTQTVRMVASSASGRMTPLSWCQSTFWSRPLYL